MTTCLCYPPRSEQWFSKVETEKFCIHYEPIRFDGQSIIKAVPQRLIFTLGVTLIVTVWLILLVGCVYAVPVSLRVGSGRFTRNARIYCWHLTAESLSDYYCFIFSLILTINQSILADYLCVLWILIIWGMAFTLQLNSIFWLWESPVNRGILPWPRLVSREL